MLLFNIDIPFVILTFPLMTEIFSFYYVLLSKLNKDFLLTFRASNQNCKLTDEKKEVGERKKGKFWSVQCKYYLICNWKEYFKLKIYIQEIIQAGQGKKSNIH